MGPIPENIMAKIAADPYYKRCAREQDGGCAGRITLEHAILYAGIQLQDLFSIIPLCEYHHAVGEYQDIGDLDKLKNEWIAIGRMTKRDMKKYPKGSWELRRKWGDRVFGE